MYCVYAAARGVAVRQARRYLQNGPRSVVSAIQRRAAQHLSPSPTFCLCIPSPSAPAALPV